jgi:hypothetical protein
MNHRPHYVLVYRLYWKSLSFDVFIMLFRAQHIVMIEIIVSTLFIFFIYQNSNNYNVFHYEWDEQVDDNMLHLF